jgi:uncharacterized cupredoxin-like copper-binding protein
MECAVVLLGLTTGHKIGLAVVAAVFIGFALVSSFVLPRRNPDFPGRGARLYYLATVLLFVAMIAAVEIFGAEGQEKTASAAELSKSAPQSGTIQVRESEWKVQLPPSKTLRAGAYDFHVVNQGKVPHNLTVSGPRVANQHTPTIAPGQSADLHVTLASGTYDLYCSIPGHKQLGMDAKLAVG